MSSDLIQPAAGMGPAASDFGPLARVFEVHNHLAGGALLEISDNTIEIFVGDGETVAVLHPTPCNSDRDFCEQPLGCTIAKQFRAKSYVHVHGFVSCLW
jgi:hypothetical protein